MQKILYKRKFAQEYVHNGFNGQRAAMKLKPLDKPASAAVRASRLLKDANVIKEIENLLPSDELESKVMHKVLNSVLERKDRPKYSEAHAYLETSLKLKGKLRGDKPSTTNYVLVIEKPLIAQGENGE